MTDAAPVQLEESEVRRLLVAERNELQAQLAAREAADRANAAITAAMKAKQTIIAGLIEKYHLDPSVPYVLDDEQGTLTAQPRPAPP